MLGSAALNVVFGLGEGLYFLIFVWACNGYCQALGWTPCVRVASNWFSAARRGRALGILGTSYQVMASVTYLVAGASVEWLGWRGAFYVPAVLLAAAGRSTCSCSCARRPTSPTPRPAAGVRAPARAGALETILVTLTNPALWVLAVTLFLLDACRYFFTDWGLAHLQEVQQGSVLMTAVKYAVLPGGRDRRGPVRRVGHGPLLRRPPGPGHLRAAGAARRPDRRLRHRLAPATGPRWCCCSGSGSPSSARRCCWSGRLRRTWPGGGRRRRPPGSSTSWATWGRSAATW